jgi:hypothetical protein
MDVHDDGDEMSGDWRERALCREVDPELFFPVAPRGPRWFEQIAEAKRVCQGCEVRTQCLGFALVHIAEGVAGGLDEDERRALRRRRIPVAAQRPVLEVGPGNRRQLGMALLGEGVGRQRVALECGVSVRTVERWAAEAREAAGAVRSGVAS